MPFFSCSHHVSVRQETRAAVSSLRTCKDKVRPDAADRTEMTQHPERQLSTMSAAWASGRAASSCVARRGRCVYSGECPCWKHGHGAPED